MKVFLYSVYDVIAEEKGPVQVAKTDGIALRMFSNTMKQLKEKGASPEEFKLLRLGVMETDGIETGITNEFNPPEEVLATLSMEPENE